MAEERRRRSSMTIAAGVLLVPVLYLLSVGPFVWLHRHGALSADAFYRIATTVYYPVTWGELKHEGFRHLLHWYVGFWE